MRSIFKQPLIWRKPATRSPLCPPGTVSGTVTSAPASIRHFTAGSDAAAAAHCSAVQPSSNPWPIVVKLQLELAGWNVVCHDGLRCGERRRERSQHPKRQQQGKILRYKVAVSSESRSRSS